MPQANDSSQSASSYFIDAENAAEMARLTNQDRVVTKSMGGLFPPQLDLSSIHDILDIACGPGGWALEVAKAYPGKQVIGIDISQLMVEYANYQARIQELPNVRFKIMDVLKPLDFASNSFDFVNARFLAGFMPKTTWRQFIQECWRVLRPGGVVRLTEFESFIGNSPAVEQLNGMIAMSLYKAGQSFSPCGLQIGTTPMLGRFLRDAGFQHIQKMAHVLECSAGTEDHLSQYQNLMTLFKLLQPFFIKTGVATPEEAERLYQEALEEMKSPDYCCLGYLLSAWGEKPREA